MMKSMVWAVLLILSVGPMLAYADELFDTRAAQEHFKAGLDLYAKHDYKGAIQEFEEATAIDPENAEAYYYIGYSYYKLKDMEKAQEAFEAAYKADAKFSPVQKTQMGEKLQGQE